MNDDEKTVEREAGVQGTRWNTVHEGYFGDPAVAQPLVDAISHAMKQHSPNVLADVGGGTGFLLHQVLSENPCDGVRVEDVDVSERQLAEDKDSRIVDLTYSAPDVTRKDLCPHSDDRLLLTMRSVLHYFGHDGSRHLLGHLREQMKPGEAFVHQSGCFQDPKEAECFDRLYALIESDKWYVTADEMETVLKEEGWAVNEVEAAPPIHLTFTDLADRYQLSDADVADIREDLTARYGTIPGVFEPTQDGFSAWLHYRIFTCSAV